MASLLLLFLCLGVGLLLRGKLDPGPLSVYVLHVALPALALVGIYRAPAFSAWAVGAIWLIFVAGMVFFPLVGRIAGWDRATVGCLVLTCGLSNTSFVGFPLLEALLGPEALPLAIPLDQLGSFLLVCSLAPLAGAMAAGQRWSARSMLELLRFPALWAVGLAFLLKGLDWPEMIVGALDRIAMTLSPVALVAVGAQMRIPERAGWGPLSVGLLYKLVLAPLLVLLWMTGRMGDLLGEVTVLEAAMAPMVTGAILAQRYGLRPELAGALLGVGVPLSLLTVSAWMLALR